MANTYTYDVVSNCTKDHTGRTDRTYSHGSGKQRPSTRQLPNALYSITNVTHNAQFTYDER